MFDDMTPAMNPCSDPPRLSRSHIHAPREKYKSGVCAQVHT